MESRTYPAGAWIQPGRRSLKRISRRSLACTCTAHGLEGHKVDSRYRRRCTPSSRGVAAVGIWPPLDFQLPSFEIKDSPTPIPPRRGGGSSLPRDEGRHEHVRDPVSPRITRNNSSAVAEIDTPMYDLTVGPPSSSEQEIFPRGRVRLVTDKSRPIATVAWPIMVLSNAAWEKELGIVMRPRDRAY